jgi:hypothetical protein
MSNLPAGYQLHITTWENDADHYMTKVMSGLTKEDVQFYVEMAKAFKSRNNRPAGMGNGIVAANKLVPFIDKLLAKHTGLSQKVRDYWSTEGEPGDFDMALEDVKYDLYMEILAENVLGEPVNEYYEYGFCRVFAEFKVYFVPAEVVIEDVTSQF